VPTPSVNPHDKQPTSTPINEELIASITSDVMRYIEKAQLFEKLDDLLCPIDITCQTESCSGDYKLTESLLRDMNLDTTAMEEVFDVLRSQGGFCDCEILYNVSESNRLKTTYWRDKS
jgi:hypothetical protein